MNQNVSGKTDKNTVNGIHASDLLKYSITERSGQSRDSLINQICQGKIAAKAEVILSHLRPSPPVLVIAVLRHSSQIPTWIDELKKNRFAGLCGLDQSATKPTTAVAKAAHTITSTCIGKEPAMS